MSIKKYFCLVHLLLCVSCFAARELLPVEWVSFYSGPGNNHGYPLAGYLYAGNSIPDANDFFVIGDYRIVEVATPKPGFIGSFSSRISGPPAIIRPTSEDDFSRQYICISIENKFKLKNGVRAVFRLDLIKTSGQSDLNFQSLNFEDISFETLYYAYLDVKPKGSKIGGTKGPVHNRPNFKSKDELWVGFLVNSCKAGIEFPMMFTFPPSMSQHKDLKDNSWMQSGKTYNLKTKELIDFKGKAIVYTEAVQLKPPNYMRIKASLVDSAVRIRQKIKQKDKLYYSEKDKVLGKVRKEDCLEVYKIRDETQIWDRAEDWLWLKMERKDSKGNIMMRCKKLKSGNVKD